MSLVKLGRLVDLLLQFHPNSFSTILSSFELRRTRSNVFSADSPRTLAPEAIIELDQELCLGLNLTRGHLDADQQHERSADNEYRRVDTFDWEDVLRAFISSAGLPKIHSSHHPSATTPSYNSSINSSISLLPPAILQLIAHVRAHSLPRVPIDLPSSDLHTRTRMSGMSPKKAHEVTRMAAYVASIVQNMCIPQGGVYIIDVGAGQGHLARELLRVVPGVAGVLALDGDSVLVERQAGSRRGKDREFCTRQKDPEDFPEGNVPKVTHRFGHITSPQSLIDAVDGWFVEMESLRPELTIGASSPKLVIVVSLHGCGSLSLDVLRAFVERRYGSHSKNLQAESQRWCFIASVTVPCCYNLLREGEYPLCSSSSSPQPTSASGCHTPSSVSSSFLLPDPLPPNAFHLAAQAPDTWLDSHPAVVRRVVAEQDEARTETESSSPSISASLAVRKVVWRALLEWVLAQKGIELDHVKIGNTSFIPPMEANAYILQNGNGLQNATNSAFSISVSTSGSDSPSLAGKIGSNLEQGRLGRLGRFPSRAYDSWATYLELVGSKLGVDLGNELEEGESTELVTSMFNSPSSSTISSTPDSSASKTYSICATLPSSLRPLARALSILYVLRCILGPLVETALLEDRVNWVQEQLEGDEPGVSVLPEISENLKSSDAKASGEVLSYEASLVPIFSQCGDSGSARNIAVVVVPKNVT
ncbi:hypothetical protein F5878DRAFT_12879 [Lentinula raphanica]|uniref:Methyltransferase domain-containing protein n=1 Tax=Lentinula raphanica TaxID=153919 RepID=A0AA38NXJ5_9AGAR|nr:hypothetical protein F5878DRAFT_12879 [Lentinula raphanica]